MDREDRKDYSQLSIKKNTESRTRARLHINKSSPIHPHYQSRQSMPGLFPTGFVHVNNHSQY